MYDGGCVWMSRVRSTAAIRCGAVVLIISLDPFKRQRVSFFRIFAKTFQQNWLCDLFR